MENSSLFIYTRLSRCCQFHFMGCNLGEIVFCPLPFHGLISPVLLLFGEGCCRNLPGHRLGDKTSKSGLSGLFMLPWPFPLIWQNWLVDAGSLVDNIGLLKCETIGSKELFPQLLFIILFRLVILFHLPFFIQPFFFFTNITY